MKGRGGLWSSDSRCYNLKIGGSFLRISTFLLKKKKNKKQKTSFPFLSAVHLARLLIPLDRRVLIQAHTKPLRPPLQSKEKQLLPNSLLSGPCAGPARGASSRVCLRPGCLVGKSKAPHLFMRQSCFLIFILCREAALNPQGHQRAPGSWELPIPCRCSPPLSPCPHQYRKNIHI